MIFKSAHKKLETIPNFDAEKVVSVSIKNNYDIKDQAFIEFDYNENGEISTYYFSIIVENFSYFQSEYDLDVLESAYIIVTLDKEHGAVNKDLNFDCFITLCFQTFFSKEFSKLCANQQRKIKLDRLCVLVPPDNLIQRAEPDSHLFSY